MSVWACIFCSSVSFRRCYVCERPCCGDHSKVVGPNKPLCDDCAEHWKEVNAQQKLAL